MQPIHRMTGKKQLERELLVNAPLDTTYELFMDNSRLASWAPVVDAVVSESGGDDSGLGRTRTCNVTLDGRRGNMVEKVVDVVPYERASFVVVDDSFGFSRMLKDYGFTAQFEAAGGGTRVRIETFYTPANPIAAVMNMVMMRRKFRGVVDSLLAGLAAQAERPGNGAKPPRPAG